MLLLIVVGYCCVSTFLHKQLSRRLGQVIYARMPGTGPLALDRAPSSMAVEPEGFNTTHELVSAMTYSKGKKGQGKRRKGIEYGRGEEHSDSFIFHPPSSPSSSA